MNANAQDLMPTSAAALADAHKRRAEAAAKLESTRASLARAREAAGECQQEADRLAAEEASWIARHSRKIAAWIEGGSHGNRPQAVADVKAAAAQMTARANLAAAAAAVEQFEAAARTARDELADATRAVEAAVDVFLNARAVQAAQRVLQLRDEMIELARQEIPNPLTVPLNALRELPPKVQEALALLEKMGPDDLSRPLNELSALSAPAVGIFRGHDNSYAERRAALIRGDLVAAGESTEPPAEQAA